VAWLSQELTRFLFSSPGDVSRLVGYPGAPYVWVLRLAGSAFPLISTALVPQGETLVARLARANLPRA
jgi:hypothetical protein